MPVRYLYRFTADGLSPDLVLAAVLSAENALSNCNPNFTMPWSGARLWVFQKFYATPNLVLPWGAGSCNGTPEMPAVPHFFGQPPTYHFWNRRHTEQRLGKIWYPLGPNRMHRRTK
jgi:hypothetical protein